VLRRQRSCRSEQRRGGFTRRCHSFVLCREILSPETHRANLEGSPVRHVRPAGILRASCRSRRFSLAASTCFQSLSQLGLDREQSHPPLRGRKLRKLCRRIGPLDDHYRGIAPRTRRGRSLGSRMAIIDAGRAAATPMASPRISLTSSPSSPRWREVHVLRSGKSSRAEEIELIDYFIGGWSRGKALPRNPRAPSKATTRYRLGAAFNRPSLTPYLDPRPRPAPPRALVSFLRSVHLQLPQPRRDCFYCLDYRRRADALTGGRGSPRSSRRVNYF